MTDKTTSCDVEQPDDARMAPDQERLAMELEIRLGDAQDAAQKLASLLSEAPPSPTDRAGKTALDVALTKAVIFMVAVDELRSKTSELYRVLQKVLDMKQPDGA